MSKGRAPKPESRNFSIRGRGGNEEKEPRARRRGDTILLVYMYFTFSFHTLVIVKSDCLLIEGTPGRMNSVIGILDPLAFSTHK